MTDREALAAALDYLIKEFGPSANWPEGDPEWVEYRPLAAAAREFLRLMETVETVWWCEKHNAESKGSISGSEHVECWRSWSMRFPNVTCRMVEAVLTRREPEPVETELDRNQMGIW